ncbi:hypothetical protein SAMN04488065_0852 [Haloplanus vescus]|uniref:DUF7979 domain-containing protein n=1 Tax=Haloplanus vescus TaxID=555874 RepID=A0A1H3WGM9_9EURY|nr:hypothetical protein [Haloplanus vescus]SDZ86255.1 hypothetical protein SAMN04488065_0852 [Haloplanus vescus]
MSPARQAVAALVVLVAVTGCLGTGSPDATPTPTATANTDCPPALTVYEVGAEPTDPDSAADYANLTADQQATFHEARNGSVESFDREWYDIDLVAYEGTYYRAGVVVC